jgi:hypothetical protein
MVAHFGNKRDFGRTVRGSVKVTRLVDMERDRHLATGDLCRESAHSAKAAERLFL